MSSKQFPPVDCSRGAPMGRAQWHEPPTVPRSVRVFRVRLDSQGYDDGGAYWGAGKPLYCATDGAGYRMFTRADTRLQAIDEFRLSAHLLRAGCPEYKRLRALEARGTISAGGILLRQRLQERGFE